MFVDVFQDSSGIASFTTSGRNDAEYVNTNVLGAASVMDFDNIDAPITIFSKTLKSAQIP